MKTITIGTRLCYLAVIGLAVGACHQAAAQDDHWNGTPTPTGELWNVPANWSEDIVPTNGCGFAGNVWLDPANGDSIVIIPAGDHEYPGVPQCGEENYNTIFGPEFGVTLDVYGSLQWDWTLAPYNQDPANRGYINMYSGSSMSTTGASINLGDGWWNGPQTGNHTTMNMYGNAQYSSLGGAGIWFGSHLNVYDTANVYINGYVNMDTAYGESDGTRSLVLGGGSLTLPENTINAGNSGSAASWIPRGILRPWGKGFDTNTNDYSITDNGTNTIVTVTPLGGALVRVYFQPVLKASVPLGTFQQLALVGDYPAVSAVYLSSTEPGLDPALFSAPVYTSSNPNVVSVSATGVATAVGPGNATITATVGALHSTNSVTITVTDTAPALAHRYSFTASSGSSVSDSVTGSPSYAATLVGGATLGGGKVTLDGSTGYVQLPAGIATGLDVITVESWASFGAPGNNFSCLWAIGYADQSGDGNDGWGGDYINVQLDNGGTTHMSFGQGTPGFNGEWNADTTSSMDGLNNVHVVAVFNPYAGVETLYTNGIVAATQSMFNNMTDPVAFNGPTYNGQSHLAYILNGQSVLDGGAANPNNYIGWDDYQGNANSEDPATILPDPTMNGSVSEFRIYSSALNAAQVKADYLLGPTKLLGTTTHVSLHAVYLNGNIVITWPTSSAYVTLVSSPFPGNGPWTPVTNGTLAIVGSNYQETIPIGAGAGLSYGLQ